MSKSNSKSSTPNLCVVFRSMEHFNRAKVVEFAEASGQSTYYPINFGRAWTLDPIRGVANVIVGWTLTDTVSSNIYECLEAAFVQCETGQWKDIYGTTEVTISRSDCESSLWPTLSCVNRELTINGFDLQEFLNGAWLESSAFFNGQRYYVLTSASDQSYDVYYLFWNGVTWVVAEKLDGNYAFEYAACIGQSSLARCKSWVFTANQDNSLNDPRRQDPGIVSLSLYEEPINCINVEEFAINVGEWGTQGMWCVEDTANEYVMSYGVLQPPLYIFEGADWVVSTSPQDDSAEGGVLLASCTKNELDDCEHFDEESGNNNNVDFVAGFCQITAFTDAGQNATDAVEIDGLAVAGVGAAVLVMVALFVWCLCKVFKKRSSAEELALYEETMEDVETRHTSVESVPSIAAIATIATNEARGSVINGRFSLAGENGTATNASTR